MMVQTALTLALLVAGLLIRTMINIAKVLSGYSMGQYILTMSVTEVRGFSEWPIFYRTPLNVGCRHPRRAIRSVLRGACRLPATIGRQPRKSKDSLQRPGEREDGAARCAPSRRTISS